MTNYTRDQLRNIDTKIERIYYAARHGVPGAAQNLSNAAYSLYVNLDTINAQSALAGDPQFLRSMLQAGGTICDELTFGVKQLNHFATALETTGDHFVATDQGARDDFKKRWRELDNMVGRPDSFPGDVPPTFDGSLPKPGAPYDPSQLGPYGPQGPPPVVTTPGPDKPNVDAESRTDHETASRRANGEIR